MTKNPPQSSPLISLKDSVLVKIETPQAEKPVDEEEEEERKVYKILDDIKKMINKKLKGDPEGKL